MDGMMLRISVHIQSNEDKNVSMECELNPHEKSMQFLREVCNIDGIEMIDSTQYTRLLCEFVAVQEGTMRSKHLVQWAVHADSVVD